MEQFERACWALAVEAGRRQCGDGSLCQIRRARCERIGRRPRFEYSLDRSVDSQRVERKELDQFDHVPTCRGHEPVQQVLGPTAGITVCKCGVPSHFQGQLSVIV